MIMRTDFILVKDGKYLIRSWERDMGASYYAHSQTDDMIKATGYETREAARIIAEGLITPTGRRAAHPEAYAEDAKVVSRTMTCSVGE